MTSRDAIRQGLGAAWRLARLDISAMRLFDRTPDGFLRSFLAAAIVAPIYLLDLEPRLPADDALHAFLVEALRYVVGWLAFPLLAYYLARYVAREERWLGYVVAYNWLSVYLSLFLLGRLVLRELELGAAVDTVYGIVTIGMTLFYLHFLARGALVITSAQAAGFVASDVALSFAIVTAKDVLSGL
jgi:hypothetical protein